MTEKAFLFDEVLVIDDDDFDQASYIRAFKKTSFARKTISFKTAEAALKFLTHPETRLPELALVDVNIPRINGLELIEHAGARLSDEDVTVALLLSCPLPRHLHRRASENENISAFLNKPIQSQALLSLAENTRARRHQMVART
ncbi:MAG: response regulator [Pseudomonadota bacterium]